MAAAAASQASEAARVLQQRSQEARQEAAKAPAEPPAEQTRLHIPTPKDPEDAPPRVRQRTVREGVMAEIEERQRKNSGWRKVEFEDGPDGQKRAVVKDGEVELPKAEEPEKAAPTEKPAEAKEAAPPAEATPAPVEASAPEAAPAPKMVKVKIDGEESSVSEDEVNAHGGVAAYQIQKSSENRLRQANAALAEAKRLQSALMEQAAKALAPPPPPEEPIDKFIAGKVDTIRFGTPEESAAALQEILTKSSQGARVDPSQIIEQAIARIKHDQVVAEIEKEFNDILANPLAKKLFVTEARDRMAARQKAGDTSPVDFGVFYRTIGTELRNLIGRPHQPPKVPAETTGSTSQAPSDKEARKASIVSLPTAAARAEAPKEAKPETREDVIAQMKRARGIQTG